MWNGASKFIANDYFIYMTIVIAYNFNKVSLVLFLSLDAALRRQLRRVTNPDFAVTMDLSSATPLQR